MLKHLVAIALILLAPKMAQAARPLVTDDARLTKAGSCQLESWMRINNSSDELWALPACNPSGNFEVTLGTSLAKSDGQKVSPDYIVQAKTIFKALKTNDWGFGFAVGHAHHQSNDYPGPNGVGSTYVYVPISISLADDALITHINLGYLHNKSTSKDSVTWGVGGEFKCRENLLYVLETYGDQRASPFIQTGFRYSVIPDVVQIDTTVGKQLNADNVHWLSIGIRLTPDKLF